MKLAIAGAAYGAMHNYNLFQPQKTNWLCPMPSRNISSSTR